MAENAAENPIRSKAQAFLNGFPRRDITSKYDGGLFTKYTGLTHDRLIEQWKAGSIVTSCNSFLAIYGTSLGLGKQFSLGDFWIDTKLPKDKKHAWVPAGSGRFPKPGDTFYIDEPNPGKGYRKLHAGLVVNYYGGRWDTIEAGQGGPGMQPPMDIIKRKSEPKCGIRGWVDIEALVADHATTETYYNVPTWLVGWWQVSWQNNTYYYKFSEGSNTVSYSKQGIRGQVSGVGAFQMNSESSLTINWPATGTVERFQVGAPGSMHGLWNGTEQIFAKFLRL